MLFNSLVFIFGFLPITLIGYAWIVRSGASGWARGWLVAASLFFYGWWNPAHLPLLFVSLAVNFAVGRTLINLQGRLRRLLLGAGCIFNLGLLGYFKYAGFLVRNINTWAGSDWAWTELMLPIGISFYTFQQIAYLVDVHQGRHANISFLDYCLFVTFFPQLIAGPIVHPGEVLPQFSTPAVFRLRARNLALGFSIFAFGLAKKVVVADHLATFVDPVFGALAAGAVCSLVEAWLALIGYSLQLYFDFSGYSDMAIGLGALFGIRLPVNFRSPYRARNIIDFWRRWHITLSRFLRDYLYIPLGGNQRGPSRRYVNLFITMGLGGLWHGAGWTFLIWGLLHGFYLAVNHVWSALAARYAPARWVANQRWWPTTAWTFTLFAVALGWVFFRAANLDAAGRMLGVLFGWQGPTLPVAFAHYLGPVADVVQRLGGDFKGEPIVALHQWMGFVPMLLLAGVIALTMPNVSELFRLLRTASRRRRRLGLHWRWRPSAGWAFAASVLFCASVLLLGRPTVFLYFQF